MKKVLVYFVIFVLLIGSLHISSSFEKDVQRQKNYSATVNDKNLLTRSGETTRTVNYVVSDSDTTTYSYTPTNLVEDELSITTRHIFGSDDRIQTTSSGVCLVRAYFVNGEVKTGTGFMIDDKVVVVDD